MKRLVLALMGLALCGCESTPYDYGLFVQHIPRSILVLPPLDETPEIEACYGWLSTITKPLAEQGYYVFPVALVDRIMKENGLPTPGEMHRVSRSRLSQVFGADAVLYVTVKEWGTSYKVLTSVSSVRIDARLVDLSSGREIWSGERYVRNSSSDSNQGGLIGLLVGALVNQVSTSILDPTMGLSRDASRGLVADANNGLLIGPLHPEHEERLRELEEDSARGRSGW